MARENKFQKRKVAKSNLVFYAFSILNFVSLIIFLLEKPARATYDVEIPFNRQQLADYLCIDRSAMSNELSKMKKEGLIDYKKNTFWIKDLKAKPI